VGGCGKDAVIQASNSKSKKRRKNVVRFGLAYETETFLTKLDGAFS
jgi:hypothetical protein